MTRHAPERIELWTDNTVLEHARATARVVRDREREETRTMVAILGVALMVFVALYAVLRAIGWPS